MDPLENNLDLTVQNIDNQETGKVKKEVIIATAKPESNRKAKTLTESKTALKATPKVMNKIVKETFQEPQVETEKRQEPEKRQKETIPDTKIDMWYMGLDEQSSSKRSQIDL